ncbi:heme ABC transporter ATP-binding protein [Klugiella xanthotipulae]|uniref:Iron complex transport system ATP-binding protein n=1 Tax=Klugiella xanthotipulae TaxID=244735 RepID=A0A543HH68_9MICO|nr:heme ABC transporter ATP-binding protein [Klugiella xanthotipulae]TQM57672.1 iron complex transport system ATP-binding protein [Klugiella xanthotipulae]
MRSRSTHLVIPDPLTPGEVAIEARGITFTVGQRELLSGVDLTVHAGEMLALIGPNGAGKSTLLGALTGDNHLTSGSVTLAGTPLHEWTLKQLARRRGVLLQDNGVFFPFTVEQVVEMGRAPWLGTARDNEDEVAVREAIESTDIHHLRQRQVPSLSGGERARTAFARVIASRTGILLLDEPTAALDLKHQEDVLQLARQRAANGDAVVVVLHDLGLAAAYADSITLLQRGRVAAAGTPAEVLTSERITAVYEHPVEVFPHPVTGALIVQPVRR